MAPDPRESLALSKSGSQRLSSKQPHAFVIKIFMAIGCLTFAALTLIVHFHLLPNAVADRSTPFRIDAQRETTLFLCLWAWGIVVPCVLLVDFFSRMHVPFPENRTGMKLGCAAMLYFSYGRLYFTLLGVDARNPAAFFWVAFGALFLCFRFAPLCADRKATRRDVTPLLLLLGAELSSAAAFVIFCAGLNSTRVVFFYGADNRLPVLDVLVAPVAWHAFSSLPLFSFRPFQKTLDVCFSTVPFFGGLQFILHRCIFSAVFLGCVAYAFWESFVFSSRRLSALPVGALASAGVGFVSFFAHAVATLVRRSHTRF